MGQTDMAEQTQQITDPPEAEPFNKSAQAGWNRFTQFLLWNVVATIVTLLFIGLLTVWS
jgi:hypothetical protein